MPKRLPRTASDGILRPYVREVPEPKGILFHKARQYCLLVWNGSGGGIGTSNPSKSLIFAIKYLTFAFSGLVRSYRESKKLSSDRPHGATITGRRDHSRKVHWRFLLHQKWFLNNRMTLGRFRKVRPAAVNTSCDGNLHQRKIWPSELRCVGQQVHCYVPCMGR